MIKSSNKYSLFLYRSCIIIFFTLSFVNTIYSQNNRTQELSSLISTEITDILKIQYLNELAWELTSIDLDSSITLSKNALELSRKVVSSNKNKWINSNEKETAQFEMGDSYQKLGSFYYYKGDYRQSIENYTNALELFEKLIDKDKTLNKKFVKAQSSTLGNLANVFFAQGNSLKTLEYVLYAIDINQKIKNRIGIISNLVMLGNVYVEKKNYEKSIEYYKSALEISKDIENNKAKSTILGNIANVYLINNNYIEAEKYFIQALEITESIKNLSGQSTHLGNLGILYLKKKDFIKSLECLNKSLEIAKKIKDINSIAIVKGNIGELYFTIGEFEKAEIYLLEASRISEQEGYLDNLKEVSYNLSNLYTRIRDFKKALEHYKVFVTVKDSLSNIEAEKEFVRIELNHEFEKKEATAKMERKKNEVIKDIIISSITIILLLVVGFIVYSFKKLRVTMKQAFVMLLNFLSKFITRPKPFNKN
ncbi:MAG: tetratricopeptide repeat protein [Vicingaceae bacterium]|nr:tetratricopeptide repeat protein [Vicingaceae bacterium]